jgi:fluoride exporter
MPTRIWEWMSGPRGAIYLWIALGSGLGGVARLWCANMAPLLFGDAFPWGILLVNIVGSFVIGLFFALTGPEGRFPVSTTARQFVMTGLCGGYTTFSAFSLDTMNLLRDGRVLAAGGNVALSVALCIAAAWAGHAAAVRLSRG